jgi:hypothetical protein
VSDYSRRDAEEGLAEYWYGYEGPSVWMVGIGVSLLNPSPEQLDALSRAGLNLGSFQGDDTATSRARYPTQSE